VVSNARATVIAFSNGHASIYLSTDGGFIGGGESHESVRHTAKKMVAVAGECQPHTRNVRISAAQQQGEVLFYLLTEPEFSLPVLIGQRAF
jgi:hypothetical protein